MNDLRPNPMVATLVSLEEPIEVEPTEEVAETATDAADEAGS